MHLKLGSATRSQLAFPRESNLNFPWEKSQWDNIVVKKQHKKWHTHLARFCSWPRHIYLAGFCSCNIVGRQQHCRQQEPHTYQARFCGCTSVGRCQHCRQRQWHTYLAGFCSWTILGRQQHCWQQEPHTYLARFCSCTSVGRRQHCRRHTRLPKNCVFNNKNHQNLEHSTIFRSTSANVSPHLFNKSGYQILRENHKAIYTVHLPYWFRAAENIVCQSCSEFTKVSPYSSMVTKGHFSWYAFLNIWKCLLFAGDGFAGAWSIDSAMLSLIHKTFLLMAPWFQRSIPLAALWMRCPLPETSEELLLLCVFRTCTEHFPEQICIFLSFTHVKKWLW